jgi:hypothetical protein
MEMCCRAWFCLQLDAEEGCLAQRERGADRVDVSASFDAPDPGRLTCQAPPR